MTKEKMVSFNETVYVGLAPNYDRSVKVIPLTRLKIFSKKSKIFGFFNRNFSQNGLDSQQNKS